MFEEKTLADCLLVSPKVVTLPNFKEKTFANSHKIREVFFLESFLLYVICKTVHG